MRYSSRQTQILQQNLLQQSLLQDVVKVAVKAEEIPSSESFSSEWVLGIGVVTIALYYALQILTTAHLG